MNLQTLKTELTTDPLPRGYSSMSHQAAADSLNSKNRSRDRQTLSGSTIYNCVSKTEFDALTAAQKETVRDIWGLGDFIDIRTGTITRANLVAIFNAQSATRAALLAAVSESISRADELGLGEVHAGDVAAARSLA